MGDHVPLQFLLGTRASRYLDPHSRASATTASTLGSSSSQPLFEPTAHPRSREREARALLERVLREPLSNEREADCRGKSTVSPTALAQLVENTVMSQRQLIYEDERSRARRPRRRTNRDDHAVNGRREEAAAFHGYRVENPQFLGVEGLARTPVVVTAQQSEDQRSRRKVQRMKLEKRRRKEMQELLREQQEDARVVERRLRERREESMARVLNTCDLASDCDLPAAATTTTTALDCTYEQLTGQGSAGGAFVQSSPALLGVGASNQCERACPEQDVISQDRETAIPRREKLELARQQKLLLARTAAPRPSFLATLKLEDQRISADDEPPRLVDSDVGSMTRHLADLELSTDTSDRRRRRTHADDHDDDDSETPEVCDIRDAVRAAKLQRELFAKSDFGGKCLGGGFAVKRNALGDGVGDSNAASTGPLDAVLDAQAIRTESMAHRAPAARRR